MMCLGLEPGAAGWKVETNPLSYGGTPMIFQDILFTFCFNCCVHTTEKESKLIIEERHPS